MNHHSWHIPVGIITSVVVHLGVAIVLFGDFRKPATAAPRHRPRHVVKEEPILKSYPTFRAHPNETEPVVGNPLFKNNTDPTAVTAPPLADLFGEDAIEPQFPDLFE